MRPGDGGTREKLDAVRVGRVDAVNKKWRDEWWNHIN